MKIDHIQNEDGSLTINLNIESNEVVCLLNDINDIEGIVNWYAKGPTIEKIYRCKERLLKSGLQILKNDPEVSEIPLEDNRLIELIVSNKNYKNRRQREQQEEDI